jgi:hypothetical protein
VKGLQHVADTMCQMFCGWRLIESKPNLANLGSGTLEIDTITGQCLFQGKSIDQPKKLQKKYAHGCDRIWRQTKSHLQCSLAHISRSNFLFAWCLGTNPRGRFSIRVEKPNAQKNESMRYGV